MTEEAQQPVNDVNNIKSTSAPAIEGQSNEGGKGKGENKKEKCKPMTKVVIRRLPPTMTQAQFIEQISPLPDHDYLYFVKADMSLGQYAFSRAYINFTDQKDIFLFREKFDNYVFVDAKGTEYPAVVEFAPFQRLPKKRVGRKKDPKCGTIESDPYYISFLESLKNQEAESAAGQPKTEYSYQPSDNAQKKVTTTPLLEYLKQRKMEKQRVRDEKREERRRRDLERKRAKDEPVIQKVLKNPDTEREIHRDNKENKEEREKAPQKETRNRKKDEKQREKVLTSRDRDGKTSGKNHKDDRKQERDGKHHKNEKKFINRRDDREEKKTDRNSKEAKEEKKTEEKKGKSYEKMRQEKRRMAELKRQAEMEAVEKKETKTQGDVGVNTGEGCSDAGERKTHVKEKNSKRAVRKSEGDVEQTADTSNKDSNVAAKKSPSQTGKKTEKFARRRSSLESGGDSGSIDGSHLRRHKSLDGEDQGNLEKNESDEKDKDKKDTRKERRIRNKDRPAMEIYRPGMGKFSKQRLEREKSTTDERAGSSESPTNNNNNSCDQKAELRSMTFKRSVSRDNP